MEPRPTATPDAGLARTLGAPRARLLEALARPRSVGELGPERALPADRWRHIQAHVTVIAGAKSPASMRPANAELAAVLGADHDEIAGQNHMIKGKAIAPTLAKCLRAPIPAAGERIGERVESRLD
jgi:hypothetical protein